MKIILKETIDNGDIITEPIFAIDTHNRNPTETTLLEALTNMMTNEQREVTTIKSLYAGDYEIEDCPPGPGHNEVRNINFLLKLVNGHAYKVLKVSDNKYELNDISDILNYEITDSSIEYKVFSIRGRLVCD